MIQSSAGNPLVELQQQIAALHRSVARQRLVVLTLVIALTGAAAWHLVAGDAAARLLAQDKTPNEISCKMIKIVDDAGKVRLQISTDRFGGFVSVLGFDGKERAFVGVGDKQAGGLVYLKDADGKTRTTYAVYKDGNAGINFRNAQDKTEAFVGASAKGFGGLINLNASDGKTRVVLDCDKDGRGALELVSGADKTEVLLASSAKGWGGMLNLNAPNGVTALALDVDNRGLGRMDLRSKDGKRCFYASADEEGGAVHVYGYDGKQRAFLGVGDKQSGGVFYLLHPDNDKARVVLGVDNDGVGFAHGRDAAGVTKRAMR